MPAVTDVFAHALRCHQAGQLPLAEAGYGHVLRADRGHADAWHLLGLLRYQTGRLDLALEAVDRALALSPDCPAFHGTRAACCHALGRSYEAVAHYQTALRLAPTSPEVHNNLAAVLLDRGKADEAAEHLGRALHFRPDFVEAWDNLGNVRRKQGRTGEAVAACEQALRLRPSTRRRITLATLLPPTYQSMADLEDWRQRFTDSLRLLAEDGVTLDLARELPALPFFLAYQGRNDCDPMRSLARLYQAPGDPPLARVSGDRIRVGFLSRCFRDHTIGRLNQGLIARLDRRDFEVVVLSVGRAGDETGDFIRRQADRYAEVPGSPQAAREMIRAQGLDILFYTDLGMDPLTYALAFSRLAPVQVVTWGHPVTTGIPTVDYFLSSDLLETSSAQEHFTETLVRLPSLAVCYFRPPPAKVPSGVALPGTGTIYACLQSPFKLHPEFDALLAGILRRDPGGTLLLLQGPYTHWEHLLRQRFTRTMPDVADRIRFVPSLARAEFLGLLASADVLLDPIHFGGGNTSYEALALGAPVVTLPSPFLRGRITRALYEQMGVADCVASSQEDYVDRAVRLGTARDYRQTVRERILARNEVLFENETGVRALEDFFRLVCGG